MRAAASKAPCRLSQENSQELIPFAAQCETRISKNHRELHKCPFLDPLTKSKIFENIEFGQGIGSVVQSAWTNNGQPPIPLTRDVSEESPRAHALNFSSSYRSAKLAALYHERRLIKSSRQYSRCLGNVCGAADTPRGVVSSRTKSEKKTNAFVVIKDSMKRNEK